MDNSALSKIRKIAKVLIISLIIIVIIGSLALVGYYYFKNKDLTTTVVEKRAPVAILLQNQGYKQYQSAVSYLNTLSGSEKDDNYSFFYMKWDDYNAYGGVLAEVTGGGVWVWGRTGLTFFSPTQDAKYVSITGCTQDNMDKFTAIPGQTVIDPYTRTPYSSLADWGSKVHPGEYVVLEPKNNQFSAIQAWPEIDITDTPWFFCYVKFDDQAVNRK